MRVEPLRGTVEAELGAHRMKRHKGKETRSMSQGERWKGEQGGGQWLGAESIDQHGNAIRRKNDSVLKLHIKGNSRVQLMRHLCKLPGKMGVQAL